MSKRADFFTALNSTLALYNAACLRGDEQAKRYYAVAVHALLGPSRPFISDEEESHVPHYPHASEARVESTPASH